MVRRLIVTALVLVSALTFSLAEADAARRGGFFRRARMTRSSNYRSRSSYQTYSSSRGKQSSQKLHETHSRSAVLDGFFGPYSGGQGHDRSWYIGR